MANRKFTEEQIISILREAEAGAKIPELCRRYGVSDATYYRWKAKYSGHMLTLTSQLARLYASQERQRHSSFWCLIMRNT